MFYSTDSSGWAYYGGEKGHNWPNWVTHCLNCVTSERMRINGIFISFLTETWKFLLFIVL